MFVYRLVAKLQHEVSLMEEFTLLVGGSVAGACVVGLSAVSGLQRQRVDVKSTAVDSICT